MVTITARRWPVVSAGMDGKARQTVVAAEPRSNLPVDKLIVAMEEGGRVRIPAELYERIGSGPGGLVQLRRCGCSVVIERLP